MSISPVPIRTLTNEPALPSFPNSPPQADLSRLGLTEKVSILLEHLASVGDEFVTSTGDNAQDPSIYLQDVTAAVTNQTFYSSAIPNVSPGLFMLVVCRSLEFPAEHSVPVLVLINRLCNTASTINSGISINSNTIHR